MISKMPAQTTLPSTHTQQRVKPWYHYLTLDILVRVFANSIFHPFIMFVVYLCIAAVHKHKTAGAFYVLYYTAFLAALEVLVWWNHSVTYGKARKVDWEKEVVVLTGGGSGLGRVLMEVLVKRGVKVGVLDVKEADNEARELIENADLCWEKCDVSDYEEVKRAVDRIREELGVPTILINNAAAPIVGQALLASDAKSTSLSPARAAQTLNNNATSHFNTLSAVLPHLKSAPNGGTVVTVSSILSHLSPANLSDYAASKSAVSSLHYSLKHEIRTHPDQHVRNNLKTVLVEIGQMDTQLFSNVTKLPWYANFFGPILASKDVANAIFKILDFGESGVIRMPFYTKLIPGYRILPGSLQLAIRWFSGVDSAIEGSPQGLVADREKTS